MFISEPAWYLERNRRWRNFEMLVNSSFIAYIVYWGISLTFSASKRLSETYQIEGLTESSLSFFGYQDSKDMQLRKFLSNLHIIILAMLGFLLAKHILTKDDPQKRIKFYLIFNTLFIIYIHGAGTVFLVLLAYINFKFADKFINSKRYPLIIWGFNLTVLIIAEYYNGFRFKWIDMRLRPLDQFHKILLWHRVSNLYMLKLISYGMDRYWAVTG